MRYTNELGLPIYNDKYNDRFNLQDYNNANQKIDTTYKEVSLKTTDLTNDMNKKVEEVKTIKSEIVSTNATAEVIDARFGEKTLGDKIDKLVNKNINEVNAKDIGLLPNEDITNRLQNFINSITCETIITFNEGKYLFSETNNSIKVSNYKMEDFATLIEFDIFNSIDFKGKNITFKGLGNVQFELNRTNTDRWCAFFLVNGYSVFDNIKFNLTGEVMCKYLTYTLMFNGSKTNKIKTEVKNCWFLDAYANIYIYDYLINSKIHDNYITASLDRPDGGYGIYAFDPRECNDIQIYKNRFNGRGQHTADAIELNTPAMKKDFKIEELIRNVKIYDNEIVNYNNTGASVGIGIGVAGVDGIDIYNNKISNCRMGIHFEIASEGIYNTNLMFNIGAYNVNIYNNEVSDCDYKALDTIYQTRSTGDGNVWFKNVDINNNKFFNTSKSTCLLEITPTNAEGFVFRNNILSSDNKNSYGIYLKPVKNGISLNNNTFKNLIFGVWFDSHYGYINDYVIKDTDVISLSRNTMINCDGLFRFERQMYCYPKIEVTNDTYLNVTSVWNGGIYPLNSCILNFNNVLFNRQLINGYHGNVIYSVQTYKNTPWTDLLYATFERDTVVNVRNETTNDTYICTKQGTTGSYSVNCTRTSDTILTLSAIEPISIGHYIYIGNIDNVYKIIELNQSAKTIKVDKTLESFQTSSIKNRQPVMVKQ